MVNLSDKKRTAKLQTELERYMQILKKEYNPQKVYLFGSFAMGKVRSWSDIDLVIIKETNKSFLERIKDVILILQPKVGLDVLVYTPDEFKNMCATRLFFKHEIKRKGIKIYDRRV